MLRTLHKFIQLESAGGIILCLSAVVALFLNNSPLSNLYNDLLSTNFTISIAHHSLSKPLLLWINDGLMAIFFLLVAAEIKREWFVGELNTLTKALLPGLGAIGGIVLPALIYLGVQWQMGNQALMQGWAIPTATDIAFALGLLSLLGPRITTSLKIFLTALAILDDLGAIIIIALFYTVDLSGTFLAGAGLCLMGLILLNRKQVVSFLPYGILGILLWFCVLKSGVHATLAGVIVAFAYPLHHPHRNSHSPLRELEEHLHPWVVYGVLPLFAFANAGLSLQGIQWQTLLSPLPLGIILGLCLGKPLGILGSCWLGYKIKLVQLPQGVTWRHMWGIACICGIGFTMSLFIGTLAFEHAPTMMPLVRLGVLVASCFAGITGYFILKSMQRINY